MSIHYWLRMLLAVVLATVLSRGTTSAKNYRTYVIHPPINNNPILEGEALPVECRDETVMKVLCARNEYEPTSFLVETDTPLEQVNVEVGPLKGTAGVLDPQTVDVRIAQKFSMPITWTRETLPWVLVHDPGMIRIEDRMPQWIRDAEKAPTRPDGRPVSLAEYKAGHSRINTLAKELIDANTLQPADVENFRQFWLTVHVPEDAKSGTYNGAVTIMAANAAPTTLTLQLKVPSFDLLPPRFEYSAYYPTMLERPETTDAQREKYNPITAQQYLAECHNMVAHGLTNPNIYVGPEQDEVGNIHFTHLSRILDLREQAGMPKGVMLYLMDGAGMIIKEGELTEQQKQRNIQVAQATAAWARSRGYSGALFMGADEYSGDRLRAMLDSYASIRAGGSGIWVANQGDFVDIMPDLLDRPILSHKGAHIVDGHQQWQMGSRDFLMNRTRLLKWNPALWLMPHYQRSIKAAHEHGHKIFSYFDPQGGMQVPEQHRRHRGLGLWKSGLDGTMTWAYLHIWTRTAQLDDPSMQDAGIPWSQNAFVIRGPQGVLDTLSWEGYREGYDDARYLATLHRAMAEAKAAGKHLRLVARTERWLDNLSIHADLDQWRHEMARRTEALLAP
ncbi:MAG: hypothetical protein ABGZ53_26300 [Fuerstiella sp.]